MAIYGSSKQIYILGGAVISLFAFYKCFIEENNWTIYQEKNNLPKHMKLQMESLSTFFVSLNKHSANTNSNKVSDPLINGPPSVWQPHPSKKRKYCLHYYKQLYVKAVPQNDCSQPHVYINDRGRLGNQICQYASLYLLRHLYGVRVSITERMKKILDEVFKNIVLPVYDSNCFTNGTQTIKYEDLFKKLYVTASQTNIDSRNNNLITKPMLNTSYHVWDYPHPRDLFLAHRDIIRSLFTFRDEIREKAISNIDAILKPLKASYSNRNFSIVTVHVRRTDYGGHLIYLYNITQLDELYFLRSFNFYRERLTKPVFLIVSDDPTWCKKNLETKDVFVIASKSRGVDMAVMSLGDHHVTSYGTFSFSGAFLGHGHITHPANSTRYTITRCVDVPFYHHISREKATHKNKTSSSSIILVP